MITVSITINRPVNIVWDYFTTIGNWGKWYGGGVKEVTPTWQKGAEIIWAGGGASPVTKFVPGQEICLGGMWMDNTYQFIAEGSSTTIVNFIESDPQGGVSYNDGGAAQKAKWEKTLQKFKECIELESTPTLPKKNEKTSNEEETSQLETLISLVVTVNTDDTIRQDAAIALGKLGSTIIEPLLSRYNQDEPHYSIHKTIVATISSFGELAVEPLIDILQKDVEGVNFPIAADVLENFNLENLKDSKTIEPLFKVIRSENSRRQAAAIKILSKIGDARSIEPTIAVFKNLGWEARRDALIIFEKTSTIDPLINSLQDESWSIREIAVNLLGQFGDARAIEPLIALLREADEHEKDRSGVKSRLPADILHPNMSKLDHDKEESKSIRRAIIASLIKIGTPGIGTLKATLNDKSINVQKAIQEVLKALGQDAAVSQPTAPSIAEISSIPLSDEYAAKNAASKKQKMIVWVVIVGGIIIVSITTFFICVILNAMISMPNP